MRNFIGILLLSITTLFSSFTPVSDVEMDSVVIALKSGNANLLSRFFDNRVDISLPDKSDNYSRSQAEMVMKDFFTSNGVVSFELKHRGENNGGKYCIGVLTTKNGGYRTTLFMKQKVISNFCRKCIFNL